MTYRFLSPAAAELSEATEYYNNALPGLGLEFPYGIVYSLEQDEILITAVMNLRRHPDSWKSRE